MRSILISVVVAIMLANVADAANRRIIVEAFANSSGDPNLDPLSNGFSDLLVAYLSGYAELEILYRDDLHQLWQELAQSRSGLDGTNSMQIGAMIQANTLIKGGFLKINGSFQANVHIYDITTTELRHSLEESSDVENVDGLAASIARRIADALLNQGSLATPQPGGTQPVVNVHFMKGLGYHYTGLYEHAVAEFMQVIALDPTRADARIWLGKSYTAGGEHDHARIEYERFLEEYPDHRESTHIRHELNTLSKKSNLP